jgi:hypothetical protein
VKVRSFNAMYFDLSPPLSFMFFSSIRIFMVVVDGGGEDWASEESMFILVPTEELLRSDRDDPEEEIFLQKPLILQKLSRQ